MSFQTELHQFLRTFINTFADCRNNKICRILFLLCIGLICFCVMTGATAPTNSKPRHLRKEENAPQYLPFGILIPCKTTMPCLSNHNNSPICALVTKACSFGGKTLIPAGTQVHGRVRKASAEGTIESRTEWVLVFADGKELKISATALNINVNSKTFSIDDGTVGIKAGPPQDNAKVILRSPQSTPFSLYLLNAVDVSQAALAATRREQPATGLKGLF